MNARDRYEIERLPAQGRQPGLYAIRDKRDGQIVADDRGTLVTFAIRDSAVDWIRGQIYLAEAGYGRP